MARDETHGWRWIGALLDRRREHGALRHALRDLGFSRAELLRGLASQLGLSETEIRRPDPSAFSRCRRGRLGTLLPELVAHPDRGLAKIGRAWILAPGVLYEIDPRVLERWLTESEDVARMIEPTIKREGLALLGPSALRRLARDAPGTTRRLAEGWVARLGR